jgi:ribokinase
MGPKNCIITLGENGCCHVSNEVAKIYPTVRVKAVDTVGAGDSFNGALVSMLAKKKPFKEAIRYALAAGSLSVLSKGSAVSMKGLNEVEAFMRENSITE